MSLNLHQIVRGAIVFNNADQEFTLYRSNGTFTRNAATMETVPDVSAGWFWCARPRLAGGRAGKMSPQATAFWAKNGRAFLRDVFSDNMDQKRFFEGLMKAVKKH